MSIQSAENSPVGPMLGEVRIRFLLCSGLLLAGTAFCVVGASRMDADALGELGIVTLMGWNSWLGLGLLVAGFSISLTGTLHRTMLPWLLLLALVAVLHFVPAYIYGTLRYSWAWKHIGIVDFIMRNGGLDRSALYLPAYHNWPGFFMASAWIAELFSWGPLEIAAVASYAPPVFEVANLVVLYAVFLKFTDDRRLVYLAQFIFLAGNWIGQDYFSPQAATFLLYLIAMLLCLGALRKASPDPGSQGGWLTVRLPAFLSRGLPARPVPTTGKVIAATLLLLAITASIAASHQLTPIILVFALTGLALIRRLDAGFAVFAAVVVVLWNLYFAAPFVSQSIARELADFGDALVHVTDQIVDLRILSREQAMVSLVSRSLTLGVLILGGIGFIRRMKAGHVDGPLLVMLAAPLPVLVMTSYGGEVIFRIYLFMLPALAFLAAAMVYPGRNRGDLPWAPVIVTIVGGGLMVGFLISNNGKDVQYRFRPTEVEAAAWLYNQAPKGTLLIEGARNYPSQFANYENFTYVPLASESPQSRREIIENPAMVFDRWLSDPKWNAGFVILTRSQKAYAEMQGVVPEGTFDRITGTLSASPRFKIVYRNEDAVIFGLNTWAPAGSDTTP